MWQPITADLGTVKQNTTLSAAFRFEGDINMLETNPSCGCTNVNWNAEKKTLTANVNVGKFPDYLKHQGREKVDFFKTVQVVYLVGKERREDTLTIKATLTP